MYACGTVRIIVLRVAELVSTVSCVSANCLSLLPMDVQ